MVQRVVVVNGGQDAAENMLNFIMGTYLGVGALMYGLYWLVDYFTPHLLANDLGLLVYIVAPVAILLSAIFLLLVLACAISFEDPISQIAYSCGISYLSIPFIRHMGWIGYSHAGKVIGYVMIFLIAFSLFRRLMQYPRVLKWTKIVAGIAILGVLLCPFSKTAINIIRAAGWL